MVGSSRLLEMFNIEIPREASECMAEETRSGATVFFVAVNSRLSAIIVTRDDLREETPEVVVFLREGGLTTILATSDSRVVAEALSRELGLDAVYVELRPKDKAELVEKMKRDGRKMLFVGDGVNDAVALGRAFVG